MAVKAYHPSPSSYILDLNIRFAGGNPILLLRAAPHVPRVLKPGLSTLLSIGNRVARLFSHGPKETTRQDGNVNGGSAHVGGVDGPTGAAADASVGSGGTSSSASSSVPAPLSFPFSVENLTIEGTLRLQFKPLIPRPPYIGALFVSFLHQPRVDLELSAGTVNIMCIQPVHAAVLQALRVGVFKFMLFPLSFPLPFVKSESHPNYAEVQQVVKMMAAAPTSAGAADSSANAAPAAGKTSAATAGDDDGALHQQAAGQATSSSVSMLGPSANNNKAALSTDLSPTSLPGVSLDVRIVRANCVPPAGSSLLDMVYHGGAGSGTAAGGSLGGGVSADRSTDSREREEEEEKEPAARGEQAADIITQSARAGDSGGRLGRGGTKFIRVEAAVFPEFGPIVDPTPASAYTAAGEAPAVAGRNRLRAVDTDLPRPLASARLAPAHVSGLDRGTNKRRGRLRQRSFSHDDLSAIALQATAAVAAAAAARPSVGKDARSGSMTTLTHAEESIYNWIDKANVADDDGCAAVWSMGSTASRADPDTGGHHHPAAFIPGPIDHHHHDPLIVNPLHLDSLHYIDEYEGQDSVQHDACGFKHEKHQHVQEETQTEAAEAEGAASGPGYHYRYSEAAARHGGKAAVSSPLEREPSGHMVHTPDYERTIHQAQQQQQQQPQDLKRQQHQQHQQDLKRQQQDLKRRRQQGYEPGVDLSGVDDIQGRCELEEAANAAATAGADRDEAERATAGKEVVHGSSSLLQRVGEVAIPVVNRVVSRATGLLADLAEHRQQQHQHDTREDRIEKEADDETRSRASSAFDDSDLDDGDDTASAVARASQRKAAAAAEISRSPAAAAAIAAAPVRRRGRSPQRDGHHRHHPHQALSLSPTRIRDAGHTIAHKAVSGIESITGARVNDEQVGWEEVAHGEDGMIHMQPAAIAAGGGAGSRTSGDSRAHAGGSHGRGGQILTGSPDEAPASSTSLSVPQSLDSWWHEHCHSIGIRPSRTEEVRAHRRLISAVTSAVASRAYAARISKGDEVKHQDATGDNGGDERGGWGASGSDVSFSTPLQLKSLRPDCDLLVIRVVEVERARTSKIRSLLGLAQPSHEHQPQQKLHNAGNLSGFQQQGEADEDEGAVRTIGYARIPVRHLLRPSSSNSNADVGSALPASIVALTVPLETVASRTVSSTGAAKSQVPATGNLSIEVSCRVLTAAEAATVAADVGIGRLRAGPRADQYMHTATTGKMPSTLQQQRTAAESSPSTAEVKPPPQPSSQSMPCTGPGYGRGWPGPAFAATSITSPPTLPAASASSRPTIGMGAFVPTAAGSQPASALPSGPAVLSSTTSTRRIGSSGTIRSTEESQGRGDIPADAPPAPPVLRLTQIDGPFSLSEREPSVALSPAYAQSPEVDVSHVHVPGHHFGVGHASASGSEAGELDLGGFDGSQRHLTLQHKQEHGTSDARQAAVHATAGTVDASADAPTPSPRRLIESQSLLGPQSAPATSSLTQSGAVPHGGTDVVLATALRSPASVATVEERAGGAAAAAVEHALADALHLPQVAAEVRQVEHSVESAAHKVQHDAADLAEAVAAAGHAVSDGISHAVQAARQAVHGVIDRAADVVHGVHAPTMPVADLGALTLSQAASSAASSVAEGIRQAASSAAQSAGVVMDAAAEVVTGLPPAQEVVPTPPVPPSLAAVPPQPVPTAALHAASVLPSASVNPGIREGGVGEGAAHAALAPVQSSSSAAAAAAEMPDFSLSPSPPPSPRVYVAAAPVPASRSITTSIPSADVPVHPDAGPLQSHEALRAGQPGTLFRGSRIGGRDGLVSFYSLPVMAAAIGGGRCAPGRSIMAPGIAALATASLAAGGGAPCAGSNVAPAAAASVRAAASKPADAARGQATVTRAITSTTGHRRIVSYPHTPNPVCVDTYMPSPHYTYDYACQSDLVGSPQPTQEAARPAALEPRPTSTDACDRTGSRTRGYAGGTPEKKLRFALAPPSASPPPGATLGQAAGEPTSESGRGGAFASAAGDGDRAGRLRIRIAHDDGLDSAGRDGVGPTPPAADRQEKGTALDSALEGLEEFELDI